MTDTATRFPSRHHRRATIVQHR